MEIGLAVNLLKAAIEDGGGTFYDDGIGFTGNGYVVGGKAKTLKIKALKSYAFPRLSVSQINRVKAWGDKNPSRLYGSWLDDGTIYIDAVDVYGDRDQAIAIGMQRGELAIFDLARAEDIRLEGERG